VSFRKHVPVMNGHDRVADLGGQEDAAMEPAGYWRENR
jgi:hypothetical protein